MGEVVIDRNRDWKSNGDTYRRMTKYVGYGMHIIQHIHKEQRDSNFLNISLPSI